MTEEKRDILNLGCGRRPIEGAVNLDRTKHSDEVDVVHDLNELPWPFEDESFDLVVARAVLEHLDHDLITSVNECWRLLRPGGELYVKLPHWQADNSYVDPTHRWFFSLHSCDVFDPTTEFGRAYSFYTDLKWRIIKGPRFNKAKTSIHVTMRKITQGVSKITGVLLWPDASGDKRPMDEILQLEEPEIGEESDE